MECIYACALYFTMPMAHKRIFLAAIFLAAMSRPEAFSLTSQRASTGSFLAVCVASSMSSGWPVELSGLVRVDSLYTIPLFTDETWHPVCACLMSLFGSPSCSLGRQWGLTGMREGCCLSWKGCFRSSRMSRKSGKVQQSAAHLGGVLVYAASTV